MSRAGVSPGESGPLVLPVLDGEGVRLRAWRTDDVHAVQDASRDPLIPLITTVPATGGEEEALAFVARQHERLTSHAGYAFAIADADDRAVGHIGLWLRDADHGRASIGYWVCPSQRRRGYAAAALATLVAWAEGLDGLHRLELYVEPWNEGSWRTAEKVGFQREGLLRSWELVGGEPCDMYMYARTCPSPAGVP
jgi:[ribosomal protein S5]-alanine N-acetyltransferase